MNDGGTILAEIRSPVADAQIVEWHWPSPMEYTARETRHMIEMSLPPFATDGMGCFPDIDPQKYNFMGSMFMRPANFAVRGRSNGGQIRVVRCAVEPDRFAATVDRDIRWSNIELKTCLNLQSPVVQMLLRRLRQELVKPGFASATLVEAYSNALMIETARCVHDVNEKPEGGRLAAWQFRRIRERIADSGAPPSVMELAQLCGVSSRHLLRMFRNLTGETVAAYIERVQITKAKGLLLDSDLPIKEIAAQLGFSNSGNFSTAFRRATQQSPGTYRQRKERTVLD